MRNDIESHSGTVSDQRSFPRITKAVSVEISPASVQEQAGEKAFTRNISGGGLSITVSSPYKIKSLLVLKFSIYSDADFVTLGEVTWCQKLPDESGYFIGVAFKPRSFSEAKKLYSVLYPYFMGEGSGVRGKR